jgi:uncharacterized membrane protein
MKLNSRLAAFVATMGALANVLGLLVVPAGVVNIHFTQIPVLLAGLSVGPVSGAFVGFIGFVTSASRLPRANPYILGGNAILGFFTGLFYSRIRRMKAKPIVPQTIAVLAAYLVQAPYVFITDVYLMAMPIPIVLLIMGVLLVEDVIGVFVCHPILFRIDIRKVLFQE